MFYKNPGKYLTFESPEYLSDCEELRNAHNYDNMEIWDRFKVWDIEHDYRYINELKSSIQRAREYMNELYKNHIEMIKKNKSYSQSVLLASRDTELNTTIIQ